MAEYDLNIFSLSDISTSDPDGFSNNGGYQFDLGSDTVTLSPGGTSQAISITDTGNETFDDDAGSAQVLNGAATINGTEYGSGTLIEAEYLVIVEDSLGNQYNLQFVSMSGDAYNIQGFTVHGPMPPLGEPLTIVNRADNMHGQYTYASAAPSCFAAATRIAVPTGWAEARHLRAGDAVCLAAGGTAPVAMVLRSRVWLGEARERKPVRLRAGALGPGCPARDLVLSPQHRVWLEKLGALAPARALTRLPRIGLLHGRRAIDYVHIVLSQHALLLAEGCPCESFWPGPMALAGLPAAQATRIRALMGAQPDPAGALLKMKEAERLLRAAR